MWQELMQALTDTVLCATFVSIVELDVPPTQTVVHQSTCINQDPSLLFMSETAQCLCTFRTVVYNVSFHSHAVDVRKLNQAAGVKQAVHVHAGCERVHVLWLPLTPVDCHQEQSQGFRAVKLSTVNAARFDACDAGATLCFRCSPSTPCVAGTWQRESER